MCSFFWKRMENDQGDLSDIVRASGGGGGSGGSGVIVNNQIADWQFPSETENFPSGYEESIDDFGDPFSMRDPLLHELDLTSSGFFQSSNSTGLVRTNVEDNNNVCSSGLLAQKILDGEVTRPCSNIFSRMLQISPNSNMPVSPRDISGLEVSTRGIKTSSLVASDMIIKSNSSIGCSMIEKGGVQISSPRNPGIKRRKTQAKKVVCIPAPAASTSRPTGEVVPSDLWAWRKYGQKPIKGSPYPRGYYRCSSSKGCSARKQVERSRNDPNMLVITYTSEHNHPWPTQRNALAGSTRSQPTKNNAASKSSPSSQTQKSSNVKEQLKDNNGDSVSTIADRSTMNASVKEEIGEIEKPIDMDDRDFDQGFHHSYRPEFPNTIQSDDFFADLGELEPDPLLLLSQGFSGHKSDEEREDKAMDPFSIFDWTVDNSLGEARRGL